MGAMGVGVGAAGTASAAGAAPARRRSAAILAAAVAVVLQLAANGVAAQQQSNGYFGVPLGELTRFHHGVRGTVYAVDARTIHIRDFHYDGEGPAAYFFAGSTKSPGAQGFRIRDERGSGSPLKQYRGKHITLTLPEGKTLQQIRWLAVWCEEYAVNFGDVRLSKSLELPKPHKIGSLRGIHGVSSDPVVVVDAQTLLVPSFSYDGEAPDAKFWVGRGPKPSPQGIRVPDENGKEVPLRRYEQKTLVLTLPGELTVFDIGHFGVWCEAFAVDFGHVQLPRGLSVPPSLRMLGVQPQSKQQQQRSLQSLGLAQGLDPNQGQGHGLSSPPESVLSLFNAAQTVRPTTYRPHTHRRQPASSGPSGPPSQPSGSLGPFVTPGPHPASSNQDESAVQILPSISLPHFDQRDQSTFQFQPERSIGPNQRSQSLQGPPSFQQPQPTPHPLQRLHELSVQQHRLQLQQQAQAHQQHPQHPLRQPKQFKQDNDLKIQALQQSHLLQVQEQQRLLQERQRQQIFQDQPPRQSFSQGPPPKTPFPQDQPPRQSFNQDQSPFRQSFNQDQPPFRQSFNQDQPPFRQNFNQDQPPFRQSFNQDQPPFRQSFNQDQPPRQSFPQDQPSRQSFSLDHPSRQNLLQDSLRQRFPQDSRNNFIQSQPPRFQQQDQPRQPLFPEPQRQDIFHRQRPAFGDNRPPARPFPESSQQSRPAPPPLAGLPSALAGLDIQSIQPSQGIELTSPQQAQQFLGSLQIQGSSLPNAPLERISPPPEQLLFKDHSRDLFAINNLADSNVDVNNLERGGRADGSRDPFGKDAYQQDQQGKQQGGPNHFGHFQQQQQQQQRYQPFQQQQQSFQQPFREQPPPQQQQQQQRPFGPPFQQQFQQPPQQQQQHLPFQQDAFRRLVQRQIQIETFGPQSRSRFLLPHRASERGSQAPQTPQAPQA